MKHSIKKIFKASFLGEQLTSFLFIAEDDLCKAPDLTATVSLATSNFAAVFTSLWASRGETDTGVVLRNVVMPLGKADCGRGRLTLKIISNLVNRRIVENFGTTSTYFSL